jgi:alpha-glucuronidase
MKYLFNILFSAIILNSFSVLKADDGYRLWLRYDVISDPLLLEQYNRSVSGFMVEGKSPTLTVTATELQNGLNGLLGKSIKVFTSVSTDGIIIAGTAESSPVIASLKLKEKLDKTGDEGSIIINSLFKKKKIIVIASKSDAGVLYGIFHFLRLLQSHQDITSLSIASSPKTKIRQIY